MKQKIPLAQRPQALEQRRPANTLSVMSRRLPFYFQGIAALTRKRCHRENLRCWQAWEERFCRDSSDRGQQEWALAYWLYWACTDLLQDGDAEVFFYLILEPMYQLEECRRAQKGVS